MQAERVDAVVVGAGVNGLVAATTLADAGWDVVLVEAAHVGGAVRSVVRTTGTVTDLFSAFYPLGLASPALTGLHLEDHGLRWSHAPVVLAHPHPDDPARTAVLHRDPADTAAALDADHPGDGERWLSLTRQFQQIRTPFLRALFEPFPPLAPGAALLRALGAGGALRLARMLALPVTRLGEELFGGEDGRLLLVCNALHADVPPSAAGSGLFAWLLAMLAQDVGFPVPAGGAGALADALAARARAAGVRLVTGEAVTRIHVEGGRASGVTLAGGQQYAARRGVLAAVDARHALGDLLPPDTLPAQAAADGTRFDPDLPTVKLNWTLRESTVPWLADDARRAGTLHVGADVDGAVRWSADIETGRVPADAFMLVGQMTTADPSRSVAGHQTLWAYTHLPRRSTVARIGAPALADQVRLTAERMTEQLDRFAPGLLSGVIDEFVQGPADLQSEDPSLIDGTIAGGTAQLHQQLIFRPLPGLGGARLPVPGLYLAGCSAHPGGGVHGAAGRNAARTALADARLLGPLRRRTLTAAARRL